MCNCVRMNHEGLNSLEERILMKLKAFKTFCFGSNTMKDIKLLLYCLKKNKKQKKLYINIEF